MAELQSRRDELRAQWLAEKEIISRIRDVKEQIEKTKIESERAEREGDLTKASELRYGKLLELQKSLEGENKNLPVFRKEERCSKKRLMKKT